MQAASATFPLWWKGEERLFLHTGLCGSDLEISVLVCGKGVKSVDQKGRGLIVSRYRQEYSIPASCQRLTFLTKSNRQGLLLKTAYCLRKKSLSKITNIQDTDSIMNIMNSIMIYEMLKPVTAIVINLMDNLVE